MLRRVPGIELAALVLFSIGTAHAGNVIFFIGDGMGFGQVLAARCYKGQPLFFERLPYQAECTTHSANSGITDSAAAATALATGHKVNNGVISMAYPGDGRDLETLLEYAQSQGKRVGLVSTAYLTHATPASFGAHEPSRNNTAAIGLDFLHQTKPNVLFGGGGNGLSISAAMQEGYEAATDTTGFINLNLGQEYLSAQFGNSHLPYEADYLSGTYPYPHLSDMVWSALQALAQDPDGFFLMVEGGRIDHACHDNHLMRAVHETTQFAAAVQNAMIWVGGRSDTLVLVTADHETGGLSVLWDNGKGAYPDVTWSTGGHTGVNVPVYAWGKNADQINGVMDNTDLYEVCALFLQKDTTEPKRPSAPTGLKVGLGQ